MLSNSPAQMCIAVAAKYNYGRQGLPDLPTRLGPRQQRSDNMSTRNSSSDGTTGTSEPYPSKGKTYVTTQTTASTLLLLNQDKKDQSIVYSSAHQLPYNEDGPKRGHHHIPVTLSQSNMSNTSDNSTSNSIAGTQGHETNDVDKTIIVIKKKSSASIKQSFPTQPKDSEKIEDKPSASEIAKCSGYEGALDQERTTEDITNEGKEQSKLSSSSLDKVRCSSLPLLKQRLGYLWENQKFTDVVFLVGRSRRKIEAHRMILASCSEIFESLLYNDKESVPLRNAEEKFVLYENDFSEEALQVFIKAMYTNEIPICLTLAMALEVFYATKKYAVVFMEQQVLEHIKDLLTIANVFEALQFSMKTVELSYLAPICWKIIEEQTADLLTYYLDSLEACWFVRILERDRLSLEEVELFQFAVRWAAHKCKVSGLKTIGRNKRAFMEPLLRHFRFTTMSPIQFNEVVVPSRILDPKEIHQIQQAISKMTDVKSVALPYKNTPRLHTSTVVGSPKRYLVTANILDGRGDVGQQLNPVQTISSDPVLNVGTRLSGSSINKRGTSATKLKNKRSLIPKKSHQK